MAMGIMVGVVKNGVKDVAEAGAEKATISGIKAALKKVYEIMKTDGPLPKLKG